MKIEKDDLTAEAFEHLNSELTYGGEEAFLNAINAAYESGRPKFSINAANLCECDFDEEEGVRIEYPVLWAYEGAKFEEDKWRPSNVFHTPAFEKTAKDEFFMLVRRSGHIHSCRVRHINGDEWTFRNDRGEFDLRPTDMIYIPSNNNPIMEFK